MKTIKIFVLTLSLVLSVNSYCYEEDNQECGPLSDAWPAICHEGQAQSPIDIKVPDESVWDQPPVSSITFNSAYKDGATSGFLTNNGHTVQISIYSDATSDMTVETDLFPGCTYVFGQVHAHFGSEHTLDGKQYELECHFVHYNSAYKSIGDAVSSGTSGALFIIGFLYKSTNSAGDPYPDNDFLLPYTDNLPQVQEAGTSYKITTGINIYNMLQQVVQTGEPPIMANRMCGYNYNGSLTTPGCNEGMNWFVLKNPQPISPDQLSKFTSVKNDEEQSMAGNFRRPQDLNGRVVNPICLNEQ